MGWLAWLCAEGWLDGCHCPGGGLFHRAGGDSRGYFGCRAMTTTGRRRAAVTSADGRLLGLLCLKASRAGLCSDHDVRARALGEADPAAVGSTGIDRTFADRVLRSNHWVIDPAADLA